jgi:2-haloacid dehalogenase
MTAIQAVVFDIGGVLLDWDPNYLYRKLIPDPNHRQWFLSAVCTPAWNSALDAGAPWDEAIAAKVAEFPAEVEAIHAYRTRWSEMLAGPIAGTVGIMAELRGQNIPLHAITNFAAPTFRWCYAEFDFLRWFNEIIVSGECGVIKPDPAIYRLLLSRTGLQAPQCLFIDDSADNIAAAQALGLYGHRFSNPAALRADLIRLGLLG